MDGFDVPPDRPVSGMLASDANEKRIHPGILKGGLTGHRGRASSMDPAATGKLSREDPPACGGGRLQTSQNG